ncbi:probable 6-phosphogluconolactonase 1 [Primulina huaijiensis]
MMHPSFLLVAQNLSVDELLALSRKLCESPYKRTVDRAKWYVVFAADRICKQVRDNLLGKVSYNFYALRMLHSFVFQHLFVFQYVDRVKHRLCSVHSRNTSSTVVYAIDDSVSVEHAAKDYEFVIRRLVKTRIISDCEIHDCPKFDLVLLKMGPNGQVASLFPNHSALNLEEEWVTYITDSPEPPPERITFTLPVINSASNVAVVVTAVNKAEAARMAVEDTDHESADVPVRIVCPVNGKLVWFLETAAASKLQSVEFSE